MVALARSDGSARKVVELGAVPLVGKLFPDVQEVALLSHISNSSPIV
jgi:hypothetical protein